MRETTLVIMAAGIGSRFGGGIKQLEPVGPAGEIIMDYSIHDAMEAGFNKVIFIIRKDLEKDFKEIMDQQIQIFVDKVYRYQTECGYSLDMMPVYFVGGGAVVMRNFGRYQQSNIHYVLDVKANAKGFETMAKIALRSGR